MSLVGSWDYFGIKIALLWDETMVKNAVTRRPGMSTFVENREENIAALVREGGSSAKTEAEQKEIMRQKRQEKKSTEPVVNLRIPIELLEEVDRLRTARAGKVSRNTWIITAIEDQVERLRGA